MSLLSFGSWVSFGPQLDVSLAKDCLSAARDAGVNFFDNAEGYAEGQSEAIMGKAIAELGWDRETFVISTKFYGGITDVGGVALGVAVGVLAADPVVGTRGEGPAAVLR